MKPTPTMNASADDQSSSIRVPPVATTRYHGAVRTAAARRTTWLPPRRHRRLAGRLRHPGQRAHRERADAEQARRRRTAPPRTAPRPARTGRAAGCPAGTGPGHPAVGATAPAAPSPGPAGPGAASAAGAGPGSAAGPGSCTAPAPAGAPTARGARWPAPGRPWCTAWSGRSRGRGERRRGVEPEVVVSGVVGSMPEVAGTPTVGASSPSTSVPSSSGGEARANGMVGSSTGPPTGPAAAGAGGARAARRARRPARGGRPGSGARQRSTSGSRSAGTPLRSCSPRRTRSMIAIAGPRPKGGRPVGGEHHGGGPRVHVGGGGGVVAVEDLRGEVARGAEQPAGRGEPRVLGQPGEPEVDEDRRAALEQHVGRLDVAVQHADGVHRDHRLGEAGGEPAAGRRPRSGPPPRTCSCSERPGT